MDHTDDQAVDSGAVERRGELGIPVTNQEPEAVGMVLEVHQQVAGLLGHPLPRRVSRDPSL